MYNEKLTELLAYLDGLTKLASTEAYICNKEIDECIGWIREVLTEGTLND